MVRDDVGCFRLLDVRALFAPPLPGGSSALCSTRAYVQIGKVAVLRFCTFDQASPNARFAMILR
jgi:hypothetical protein